MRRFTVIVIILVILVQCFTPGAPASAQDVTSYLLSKINELRTSKGLNALSINPLLTAAAQAHSNYLASTPYIHPHRERDGSLPQDRAARAGYSGRAGENVVGGTSATVEWAFNWWVGSPVHYNNMLSDWTEIGIGFAEGGAYGKWYTTLFGNMARAPSASEGYTGVNPASSRGSSAPGGGAAAPPQPTRRPRPTDTPTITYTPSITYTPRPTFTPTETPTAPPPTATAILLDLSPQPGVFAGTRDAPQTPTPIAVAVVNTPHVPLQPLEPPAVAASQPEAPSSNPLRGVLPLAILVQGIVIVGLVISAVIRRRMR